MQKCQYIDYDVGESRTLGVFRVGCCSLRRDSEYTSYAENLSEKTLYTILIAGESAVIPCQIFVYTGSKVKKIGWRDDRESLEKVIVSVAMLYLTHDFE